MERNDLISEYRETSEIKNGVHRIKSREGKRFYKFTLDNFPEDVREKIKNDFRAAEIVLEFLDGFNYPEAYLDEENDLYFIQDKGVGTTEDTVSFYQASAFHLLTSKTDVKGNIVEGNEGYAPIDFEAFLRSPITEKASYYRYGRKLETNVELYRHTLAEIELEARRHGIDFNEQSLIKASEKVAKSLKGIDDKLRQRQFDKKADNLKTNTQLILEKEITFLQ